MKVREIKNERSDFAVQLEQSRKEKKFTDVKLKIGDKLFDAHRIILSLYSPVLEAAISDHGSTTKICPISEEYVDVEIVEDLLSFLYTGSIKLTSDNAYPVCVAAHFLQIKTLLEPSVDYLCELINVDNVLKFFLFSIDCQSELLRNYCLRFIVTKYEKMFQNLEILKFPFESLKSLLAGLKQRFLGTDLREHTFHCIVRWTEKNPSERLEHLPILLENIPLVELPVEFLEQTVSEHSFVKETNSCAEMLSNAITNNETSWKTKDNLVVIGRYRNENEKLSRSMFLYSSKEGSWKRLPNASEHCTIFGATVANAGNIIVSGERFSWEDKRKTDIIEMFDWLTQTWLNLPKMPIRLCEQSMATLNGHLYVAGKLVDINSDNPEVQYIQKINKDYNAVVVVCYSFEAKQWKFLKTVKHPQVYNCLIPYKDYIYAIGAGQFKMYDPVQNQWTTLEPIIPHSCYFAAALHKDKIYVSSDYISQVYDLETDRWSTFPAPPVRGTSFVSLNGKLLAIGSLKGLTSDSKTSSKTVPEIELIYEFDLETHGRWRLRRLRRWNKFGKLPAGLSPKRCLVGGFH